MDLSSEVPPSRVAYDSLAADYDAFTAGYAHAPWFASLHARARELGLTGDHALDLACGTGKSTAMLIEHGYVVQACDISPRMIEVARRKWPRAADAFFVADMRQLPRVREVDVVLCLDDAVNYLLSRDDVESMFRGAARALRPGGFAIFDVNTLATYRTAFAQVIIRQSESHFFAWQGLADALMTSGAHAVAELEAFALAADGTWSRTSSRHEQRHHPRDEIIAALDQAGFECCAVDGQRRGGIIEPGAQEEEHIKFVYFARRR